MTKAKGMRGAAKQKVRKFLVGMFGNGSNHTIEIIAHIVMEARIKERPLLPRLAMSIRISSVVTEVVLFENVK